jgi:chromosome segregation ATPase
MLGDNTNPRTRDLSTSAIASYKGRPKSIQWRKENVVKKEVTGEEKELKAKLGKVEKQLQEARTKLKAKTQETRARYAASQPKSRTMELDEKIAKAKEELAAKERQVEARRAKKTAMRERWGRKQQDDFKLREAKRQKLDQGMREESSGLDHGMKMEVVETSTGAGIEDVNADYFDIDIYEDV